MVPNVKHVSWLFTFETACNDKDTLNEPGHQSIIHNVKMFRNQMALDDVIRLTMNFVQYTNWDLEKKTFFVSIWSHFSNNNFNTVSIKF